MQLNQMNLSASSWSNSVSGQKQQNIMSNDSTRVESISIIETNSSATSQSFNNIPELWTIDGRTKSPSSQKSTSPTGHETLNKSFGEGEGMQNKDNTENNNMVKDKSSSG